MSERPAGQRAARIMLVLAWPPWLKIGQCVRYDLDVLPDSPTLTDVLAPVLEG